MPPAALCEKFLVWEKETPASCRFVPKYLKVSITLSELGSKELLVE